MPPTPFRPRSKHGATSQPVTTHNRSCSSPWLDVASAHPDTERFDQTDLLLPIERLRRDGELYAGRLELTAPTVSPRHATDDSLVGLTPLLVTAGERELFFPEAQEFVRRVQGLGGTATLLVEPFGQHATALAPLPETADIRRTIAESAQRWMR